ncbi:MAG TPA: ferritin-like domain-containing protein [Thermoanaerobaculia bacterium]|jgi:hypothetical protein|nr:ferritin-like domain-containing protein [Thermoanaerobaculia bacterium]
MTTVTVGSRTIPIQEAIDKLTTHLQAIVAVEFFTIPVYLTGVYSFTRKALEYVDPNASDDDDLQPLNKMQQKALSVAVQEMYHMQLAANLCNALCVTPQIEAPKLPHDAPVIVPHLVNADGSSVELTKLGNFPAMLEAFIRIEQPDAPGSGYPEPNDTATYQSISDLYHATAQLIGLVATAALETPADDVPPFDCDKQVSYGTFTPTYTWNTIPQGDTSAPTSAMKAINAITDQGEGKDILQSPVLKKVFGAMLKSGIDVEVGNVDPEFQPKKGSRFAEFGMWAHEDRFTQLRDLMKTIDYQKWQAAVKKEYHDDGGYAIDVFYPGDGVPIKSELPSPPPSYEQLQDAVNVLWSVVVDSLASGFGSGELSDSYPATDAPDVATFNDVMLVFKYGLPLLWQSGNVPSFTYLSNVTSAQVKAAFDVADPFYLAHWDDKTAELRKNPDWPLNSCQGLNTCAGRGWGGLGTKPGDGQCATADFHTCGGNNHCTNQGGCGFLSAKPPDWKEYLPPEQQWIPGINQGAQLGGCQTPIGTLQVFSSDDKATIDQQTGPDWTAKAKLALKSLAGKNVWEHARTLRGFPTTPPSPTPPYDGSKRRAAVQATSVE